MHADRLMLSAAGGQALLSDGQGIVLSGSSGMEITAEGRIRLEGERISANVPLEINMYRSPVRAGQKREDIQAKGSRSNPPTGGGESGFTMGNEFNNASETVVLCGTEFTMYSSYKDAPDDLAELEAEAEGLFGVQKNRSNIIEKNKGKSCQRLLDTNIHKISVAKPDIW